MGDWFVEYYSKNLKGGPGVDDRIFKLILRKENVKWKFRLIVKFCFCVSFSIIFE